MLDCHINCNELWPLRQRLLARPELKLLQLKVCIYRNICLQFLFTVFVYNCLFFSGEQKASRALKEASDIISESPAALQLRYLQTLTHISAEKNSTIIFPLPIEIMNSFLNRNG